MLSAVFKLSIIIGLIGLCAHAQNNDDYDTNRIDNYGKGMPESTILNGKVTKLDDIVPVIFLNRTKANLNCGHGSMEVALKFEQSFHGIIHPQNHRSGSCTKMGNGSLSADIDIPLKGCGTEEKQSRVYVNNIVVRFHSSLESDGDEFITIVCRYPPPVAIAPLEPSPEPRLQSPTPQPSPKEGSFQGMPIMLICSILFLSLVLLGLASSYYFLRNQRIHVIRRHPLSPSGSEISKFQDSGSGNLSIYDGLRIPRAHTIANHTPSSSISESEMAVETIPSDYPSESPSTTRSAIGAMDINSLRRSFSSNGSGSFDNKGYHHTEGSYYSEQCGQHSELEVSKARLPLPDPPPLPHFDVEMHVKRTPPAAGSISSIDTDSTLTPDGNLSTIMERDEYTEIGAFQYKPEIHPSPPPKPAPIYSKVVKKVDKQQEVSTKSKSHDETDLFRSEFRIQVNEPENSTTVAARHKPEITSHFIDDVFLRTITQKKTIEDIERHKRQVTEYHHKPPSPPANWDIEIRNYPNPVSQNPEDSSDWETHSENSSIYAIPTAVDNSKTNTNQRYRSTLDIPIPDPPPRNWDSLVRVLEYTPNYNDRKNYLSEQTLTLDDQIKWRKILTTESNLRTMLTKATSKEDYEQISKDARYEKLFEPNKWQVIIRIITPQERLYDQKNSNSSGSNSRYRKKSEIDGRNRKNSLPTLYEYDSDNSSFHNMELGGAARSSHDHQSRSRRTSRSSMRSDMDVRSMSEIMVDFARPDVPDNMSDVSSYYRGSKYYDDEDDDQDDQDDAGSLVRSLSQPSLARSNSEFTESWGIQPRDWNLESPNQSPRSSMRSERHLTTLRTFGAAKNTQ